MKAKKVTQYILKVQYHGNPLVTAAVSDTLNGALAAYRALGNKGRIIYARVKSPALREDYIIA